MSETEDPRAYEALRIKDAEIERLKTERAGFKSYFEHMESEKDAEIARLKGDVEYWHHIASEKDQLITELCDALGKASVTGSSHYFKAMDERKLLIKRAREATR